MLKNHSVHVALSSIQLHQQKMGDKPDGSIVKCEPEMVICHNNDDVELAFDPFGDDNPELRIKEEYVEPVFEDFDVGNVKILEFNQAKIEKSSDQEDDFYDHNDDYFDHFNDGSFDPETEIVEAKHSTVISSNLKVAEDLKPSPHSDTEDLNVQEIVETREIKKTKQSSKQKPKTQIKSGNKLRKQKKETDSDVVKRKTIAKSPKKIPVTFKEDYDGTKNDVPKKKGRPKSANEHKCYYCNKTFQYASLLKIHNRTHLIDKGFNCPVCKKSFARSDHCKQHVNNVHAGEVIEGVLRKPTFEQKCKICDKVFHHSGNLRKHMVLHTGERPFSCDICGKTFVLSQHLKSHMKLVHTDEKNFQCSLCGKLFNHSGNYKKHMNVHNGVKNFHCFCGKSFGQSSNYQAHMRVHMNDRPYKCDEYGCDKSFVQAINLTLHKRVHSGEKPFECETCQRKFRRKSQCIAHMKVHSSSKMFKCSQCTRQFTHQTHLKSHEKLHSIEPRFKCTECDRAFIYNHQLVIHIRGAHTGERPFVCTVCNASFASIGQQKRHERIQHGDESDKGQKKCPECNKTFADRRLLVNHLRIHLGVKPFKCDYCEKTFITKNDCKKHMRVHTGEKPYSCDICQKKFTFSNSYRIHMRNHAGEKPFDCKICGKAFSCSSVRSKHVRAHNQTAQHTTASNEFEISKESAS